MAVTTDRASPLCSSVSARRGSWIGIPTIWYPDARLGGKAYSEVVLWTVLCTKKEQSPQPSVVLSAMALIIRQWRSLLSLQLAYSRHAPSSCSHGWKLGTITTLGYLAGMDGVEGVRANWGWARCGLRRRLPSSPRRSQPQGNKDLCVGRHSAQVLSALPARLASDRHAHRDQGKREPMPVWLPAVSPRGDGHASARRAGWPHGFGCELGARQALVVSRRCIADVCRPRTRTSPVPQPPCRLAGWLALAVVPRRSHPSLRAHSLTPALPPSLHINIEAVRPLLGRWTLPCFPMWDGAQDGKSPGRSNGLEPGPELLSRKPRLPLWLNRYVGKGITSWFRPLQHIQPVVGKQVGG